MESYNRTKQAQAKEKASFDYVLASLIVKGVGICLGSKETFPKLEEAYTTAFSDDIERRKEEEEEQRAQLSALRFKQFAQTYNKRFRAK